MPLAPFFFPHPSSVATTLRLGGLAPIPIARKAFALRVDTLFKLASTEEYLWSSPTATQFTSS
jgi:hypothetical protein